MEKARLDCICQLLEITERERHHELLLSVKNLQELGVGLFPYIVPVLPHPLPKKVVKGEHFVLVDLLKSFLGGLVQGSLSHGNKGMGAFNCWKAFQTAITCRHYSMDIPLLRWYKYKCHTPAKLTRPLVQLHIKVQVLIWQAVTYKHGQDMHFDHLQNTIRYIYMNLANW